MSIDSNYVIGPFIAGTYNAKEEIWSAASLSHSLRVSKL